MTFFKISCALLILFLSPLFVFNIGDAFAMFDTPSSITFIDKERLYYPSSTSPQVTVLTIPSISIGTQTDRLLVASISLDNQGDVGAIKVNSVQFQGGAGCTVPANSQNFTSVSGAIANNTAGDVRTEIWYLLAPPQNQDCTTIVTLDKPVGRAGNLGASAVARTVFYSGVHQVTPIDLAASNTNGVANTTPTVSLTPGANSTQIIFDTLSTTSSTLPSVGADQIRYNRSSTPAFPTVSSAWSAAYSYQNGTGADPQPAAVMSYTSGNSFWAISAIMINSCDIGNSCSVAASGSSSGSNDKNGSCHGDCSPPTLGIDKNNKRVVTNGFAFNQNPVDAELYFTPYPLITAYVGEENTIDLRIYENDGPTNLAHVAIAFGLGHGETFTESNAVINWDRSFDGKETVSITDPYNVLDNVRVNATDVDCDDVGSKCTHLIFYHTFRAPLEFNMVATNIWDQDRNAWQNYFNHGLQVVGESLNPPNIHSGIYKGKIYQLTEVEKNKSVDDDGNTWTFDYGIWNKDYVDVKKTDRPLVNADKIWAINYVLNEDSVDDTYDAYNYDRYHVEFPIQKEYQIILAENLLEEMCPKCFDDSFEEIDDISYYEFEESLKRYDDSEFVSTIEYEAEMAEELLEEMMSSFYPGIIFEENDFS
ncbi:MAG: hypothetical protein HKP26_06475 [Nitrosopumilus sp.]|nr:hypothetical protein [Nitrosopumilus sp.]